MEQRNYFFGIVLLFLVCSFKYGYSQTTPQYTHWVLAHMISDYENSPTNEQFITGGPIIEQLDSTGGVLTFFLTPRSNHDCRQAYKVGWYFDQPVNDLEEGEEVHLSLFCYPVVDTTIKLMDCFTGSKEAAAGDQEMTIRFIGGDSAGLESKPELAFYWDASSPARFYLESPVMASFSGVDSDGNIRPVTGSFLVQDQGKNTQAPEVPFGTFAFEVSKRDAFTFRVLYLYDGMESTVSAAGAHRLILDKLMVDHTVAAGDAEPVMNIYLMGILEEAIGRELQIIIHPLDSYRRPMEGIQGDTAFCDRAGYVVAYSPVLRIPERHFYLEHLKVTIPYYALNLPTTQSGHLINLYAEVYLDGRSIGVSKLVPTNFFW